MAVTAVEIEDTCICVFLPVHSVSYRDLADQRWDRPDPASDADRSLPALMVAADPCLISQAGSRPRIQIRLGGSRSDLSAITLWTTLLDLLRAFLCAAVQVDGVTFT